MEAGSVFPLKPPVSDTEEAHIKCVLNERTTAHPALPARDFLGPL